MVFTHRIEPRFEMLNFRGTYFQRELLEYVHTSILTLLPIFKIFQTKAIDQMKIASGNFFQVKMLP